MSATTVLETTSVDSLERTPFHPVTLRRVIRSEWIKLRSVRSTIVTIGISGLAVAAIGVLISVLSNGTAVGADGASVSDAAGNSLFGTNIAQILLGILGALIVTTEYSTGMIRATMTAVPKRVPVLWAKAIVLAGVTFVTIAIGVSIAFFVGQALYGGAGAGASFFDPGVPRALLGAVLFPTAIAVIGVALGTLTRHTATAAGLLFGGLFVLPILLSMVGGVAADAVQYLPSEVGQATTAVIRDPDLLSPTMAFAIEAAWVVGLLGVSAYVLKRRDV